MLFAAELYDLTYTLKDSTRLQWENKMETKEGIANVQAKVIVPWIRERAVKLVRSD